MNTQAIRLRNIRLINVVLAVAAFLFILTLVIMTFSSSLVSIRGEREELENINDGWVLVDDMQPVHLPMEYETNRKSVTIRRVFYPEETVNRALYFSNQREGIVVKAGGEEIFQVNTTEISKAMVVKNDAIVYLPKSESPYLVEITFSGYKSICSLPNIESGSYYALSANIIASEFITAIGACFLLLLVLLLLFSQIFFSINHLFDRKLVGLDAMLLSVSVWIICDSRLTALLKAPPEVFGLLCYGSLMLLPLALSYWALHTCGERYYSLNVAITLSLTNIVVQMFLALGGTVGFHDMLMFTHAITVFCMGIIWHTTRRARRRSNSVPIRFLTYGLWLLLVVAACAITGYWLDLRNLYRMAMLLGVVLFFMSQIYGLLCYYQENAQEDRDKLRKLEIYRQLSYVDALTNLENRRAFEEKMANLDRWSANSDNAVLVMMDLNGLKHTNDTYGHAAGDELIVTAAQCIRYAYGAIGQCYRIGGDEFAVIVPNAEAPLTGCTQRLKYAVDKARVANPQWSIAKGESNLVRPDKKRHDAISWKQEADVNMYIDKVSSSRPENNSEERELRKVIRGVVNALEARDPYTANHSIRVADLSVHIGQMIGASPQTLLALQEAASVHDIGKIAIPDAILRKPNSFTDEEYELAKEHAAIGAQIISHGSKMDETAQIVRHHHERYDGRGYPDGLSGESIPLGARIIAFADSMDAMLTDRCYRKAQPLETCREEILKNLGKMYDPAIGQIILANWADIEKIIHQHNIRYPRYAGEAEERP